MSHKTDGFHRFQSEHSMTAVFGHLRGDHPHIWGKDEFMQNLLEVSLFQKPFGQK